MGQSGNAAGYTRRGAMVAAGAATLALTVPGLAQVPGRRPNFLFIMADDLGYADLSCYGRRDYETQVLDELAAQGMRFTHGYANSAVCSATRVGLITGRYQYRLRVGLDEPLGTPGLGLPPEHPTLPSQLRTSGYHTALIGKWHMGPLPNFGPLQSGYDEFWGNRGGGVDYFTHEVNEFPDLWDGDVPIERVGYYTDLLADRSIEFLDARAADADTPWLLSLHFTAPHWPWEGNDAEGQAESERLTNSAPDRLGLRITHFDGGDMETYAAMVTNLDANIGRVLARLAANWGWNRIQWWCSPATTAGNGFRTPGRSPGARPNCLKAASGCPSSSNGRGSRLPAARAMPRRCRWISCPLSLPPLAVRPIRLSPATGWT